MLTVLLLILAAVVAWLAVALVLAVLIGRAVRLADAHTSGRPCGGGSSGTTSTRN